MVERSLSMREVPGSIPGISKLFQIFQNYRIFCFILQKNYWNGFQPEVHFAIKSTILISPLASMRPSASWSTCLSVILSANPVNALLSAVMWTLPWPSLSKTLKLQNKSVRKNRSILSRKFRPEMDGLLSSNLDPTEVSSGKLPVIYLEAFVKVIHGAWVWLLRNLPKHWEKIIE